PWVIPWGYPACLRRCFAAKHCHRKRECFEEAYRRMPPNESRVSDAAARSRIALPFIADRISLAAKWLPPAGAGLMAMGVAAARSIMLLHKAERPPAGGLSEAWMKQIRRRTPCAVIGETPSPGPRSQAASRPKSLARGRPQL